MSTRSALAGAVTSAALVAALGSPAAVEAGREAASRTVGDTLTGFAAWDLGGLSRDAATVVVIRIAVALVLVAGLCAVAGRARSRSAAFLAGWGSVVLATTVAGASAYLYEVHVVLDGSSGAPTLADGIATAANAASTFGLWTGWLVGLAVALTTRTEAASAAAHDEAARAAAPANRRITEPPPPWWAPTRTGAGDGALRPGPTVFLPGGGHTAVAGTGGTARASADGRRVSPPPVVPEATYEMTTKTGDPHPSDPDATRPIGMPAPGNRESGPSGPGDPGGGERGNPVSQDGDATTPMTTADRDATVHPPRPDA